MFMQTGSLQRDSTIKVGQHLCARIAADRRGSSSLLGSRWHRAQQCILCRL